MLIKLGEEHLVTSELLYEQEQYKFSITHSYYAMFSFAKALLIKVGYTTKTHEGLISGFSLEYVKKRGFSMQCFKGLTSARGMRTKATYDYTATFNKEEASEKIKQTYEFMEEARKFF